MVSIDFPIIIFVMTQTTFTIILFFETVDYFFFFNNVQYNDIRITIDYRVRLICLLLVRHSRFLKWFIQYNIFIENRRKKKKKFTRWLLQCLTPTIKFCRAEMIVSAPHRRHSDDNPYNTAPLYFLLIVCDVSGI